MEATIGIVVIVGLLAWWLWSRRRAPERKIAKLRVSMGYAENDAAEAARLDEWIGARGGRHAADQAEHRHGADRWADWLDRPDVLIIDTETTGLGNTAEVLEVAVLDTAGELRFHALSLPKGRIPTAASDIHGLTRDRLKAEGARPWPDVHRELAAVLAEAKAVLAWNADFDRRMLRQTGNRHGLRFRHPPASAWHDLIPAYRKMRPGGRHRLVDAVRRERVSDHDAHRAIGDCCAVLAVMRAVVNSE